MQEYTQRMLRISYGSSILLYIRTISKSIINKIKSIYIQRMSKHSIYCNFFAVPLLYSLSQSIIFVCPHHNNKNVQSYHFFFLGGFQLWKSVFWKPKISQYILSSYLCKLAYSYINIFKNQDSKFQGELRITHKFKAKKLVPFI